MITQTFEALDRIPPIFVGSLNKLNKWYKSKLNSISDQWLKFYMGLNSQPEMKILNRLYLQILLTQLTKDRRSRGFESSESYSYQAAV